MDVLTLVGSWLWWVFKMLLGLVWLLIGGWVSMLLQIAVVILAIYTWKVGWRRAPFEAWRGARTLAGWGWAWLRGVSLASSGPSDPRTVEVEVIREVRVKEFGDVNLSTALTLMMALGLWSLTLLR